MSNNNAIVPLFDEEVCANLDITLEAQGKRLLVILAGKIDAANCVIFAHKMQKALEVFANITADCAGLSYLSSAGVGAFAAILKQAKEKDGNFTLSNVPSEVHDLLKILDFEQFFEITDGKASCTQPASNTAAAAVPPAATAPAAVPPAAVSFPLVIKCPACKKALKVPKSGRYRCSGCKAILTVSDAGGVALG